MWAVLDRDEQVNLVRKAGVMSVVLESGGEIRPADIIDVERLEAPHRKLDVVEHTHQSVGPHGRPSMVGDDR